MTFKPSADSIQLIDEQGDSINLRDDFYVCGLAIPLAFPATRTKKAGVFQGIDIVRYGRRQDAKEQTVTLPAGSLLLRDRDYWGAFDRQWERRDNIPYEWIGVPPDEEGTGRMHLLRCFPRPPRTEGQQYLLGDGNHTIAIVHAPAYTRSLLAQWPDQNCRTAQLEDVQLVEQLGLRGE